MDRERGILVGCDEQQEWLLPWWYSHLRQHHPELPIAFGDFGMSRESRQWCEQRGLLIPNSQISLLPPEKPTAKGWLYGGERWVQRDHKRSSKTQKSVWFRKPLLMKQSPFIRTLWIDLDCQILGDLSPLFSIPLMGSKMALREDNSGYIIYMESLDTGKILRVTINSTGVVVFENDSPLLDFWIFVLDQDTDSFYGDDSLLSFLIQSCQIPVSHIPDKYNWEYHWGSNPGAVVQHWVDEAGKNLVWLLYSSSCLSTTYG